MNITMILCLGACLFLSSCAKKQVIEDVIEDEAHMLEDIVEDII